jgi:6-pyruvoyltetrahydropterin/6-carboxytetrahydropterin synthase
MEHFHVRVASDDLVFSAAHFITLESGECEQLHGHNYRVAAEVRGPLGESGYVTDFRALREAVRAILGELDHRVLLPTESPLIHIAGDPQEVEVTFGFRRWVFPRGDCLLLRIANTTAELLAKHIGRRLLAGLTSRGSTRPELVRIEVEECFGRWAVWESTQP